MVQPILWIVMTVLVAFAVLVIGGGFLGALRASRSGESILRGGARGLLKGVIAFLVVGAVSFAALTALSALWIAYAYLHADVLKPS